MESLSKIKLGATSTKQECISHVQVYMFKCTPGKDFGPASATGILMFVR